MDDTSAPTFHFIVTDQPTAHHALSVRYSKGRLQELQELPEGAVSTIWEIASEDTTGGPEEIAAAFGRREPEMVCAIGGRVLVHLVELVTGRKARND
ncbi:hypothetical protein E1295_38585 [Nonomuraea mesophila]|uniref:Uncharacterized protein n=1 Tax=Nonomuraea mesophila TaxID=2530382 RepID=A0A4R5EFI2_9ACTN|nr:hypothetical protein E1295_38585 [Nonomuraea mesophila]